MTGTQATGIAVIGIAAIAWYVWSSGAETRVPSAPSSVPVASPSVVDPVAAPRLEPRLEPTKAPTAVSAAPASIPLDEPALMNSLRQLGDSSPLYSLQMAREGDLRFPGSPDAAERGWFICKSLVNLENFYEARDEARLMVAKYPGTFWADDVERHLLSNPLDLPGDPPREGSP